MITKICTKCGIKKNLDEFNNDKQKKDGKRSRCIDCTKLYYVENKDIMNVQQKNYRDTHKEEIKRYRNIHEEKIKLNAKKYRDTHKDEIKIFKHKYYIENKDIINSKIKQYQFEHPEIIKKCNHNIQAKRRGWGKIIPINKSFKGSHLHHLHINDDHQICIYISTELHKSIWHAYNKPETMIAINLEVMRWYYGLTIKW